jgi:uncharacterized protein YeaC (DUF1315 family)
MDIRVGRAQSITAIDDGGVSMSFRRDPASNQLLQRMVLSIEVTTPLHDLPNTSRQKEKCMQKIMMNTLQIVMPFKYTSKMLDQICHSEFLQRDAKR